MPKHALHAAISLMMLFLLCLCCASTTAYATETSTEVLLVNHSSPLPRDYKPADLVNLYAQKRHFRLASSEIYLEREVFEAANEMFKQAEKDGVNKFTITSGYRTWEAQEKLYFKDTKGTAAAPGESEHQTGLAFDVTTRHGSGGFEKTKQYKWLIKHCWDYGFILRYPKDKEEITGFACEPWHYRYVGVDIARVIHDNDWTLEEYCEANEK